MAVLKDDVDTQIYVDERIDVAYHIWRIEAAKEINLLHHRAAYLLWVLLGLNYFDHVLLIFQKFADILLLLSGDGPSGYPRRVAASEEGASILFGCA
jgi:hypothetical protein